MKVLITGGNGFLGRAVCRRLTEAGHDARSFHRHHSPELTALGIRQHLGDLRDADAVGRATAGCEAVVHAAARVAQGGAPAPFFGVNVTGTRHVLDACRRHGVGVLVHTSSPSVVFAGADIAGDDESLPYAPAPLGPYAASKAVAERLVLAANGPDLATAALRPHWIWGPGDPHFAPRLTRAARSGLFPVPGGGRKPVDTVHIENAALAHLLALDRVRPGTPAAGRPYFVTQGEPRPLARFLAGFFAALGYHPRLVPVPGVLARAAATLCEGGWAALRLPGAPPLTRMTVASGALATWFDIGAARTLLGYRPVLTTDQGFAGLRAARRRAAGCGG
ncbi:NAD-dependent epimerase/dehydratase family protein [Streptomyces syringium]|uniref:NAD-dependent epimerase/dehydratase family protein n=1 Tax=Streptomyces syringium TaxID=76729 RepID=UPI0033EF4ADA